MKVITPVVAFTEYVPAAFVSDVAEQFGGKIPTAHNFTDEFTNVIPAPGVSFDWGVTV
ncbi:hypothetical protein AINA4_01520 [Aurantimicrobium sp. INA4]|nr:hypothetical protein AINA4_01520 [Aurantimicrobium sp. INA4]